MRYVFLLVISLLTLTAGAALSLWIYSRPTGLDETLRITLAPGSSARAIGAQLEREGIVRSGRIFAWTVRLQGLSQALEAGTYALNGLRDTPGVIQQLLKAPLQMRRATIPEGLTRHETAGVLARQGIVDSLRFVELSGSETLAATLGIQAPTLEGYLFPETYFFAIDDGEEEVIRRLVDQFHRVLAGVPEDRLGAIGLDLHQAVTLASIVEREAQVAQERPVIAGVFLRRLSFNRRLESCATVEYALGVHKKRLTNADLRVESPFNTYRHRGLPPAPIGSPGEAALKATFFPEQTEFLYFVARGDGTHIFSRTHTEHEAAKQLVKRQAQRGSLN